MSTPPDQREPEEPPIRFTDNRKINRDAAEGEPVVEQEEGPTVAASLLDERTADLQRLQAEYANYRKRAERDRLLAGDAAVARVLNDLLPVVDDLDRAAAHGDLTGPLKAVADKLEGVTSKLGLTAFGEVGDPFDPSRHEAVLHDESSEVSVPTCTTIMRPGYTVGDRLLRPAMVGVSDPASPGTGSAEGAAEDVFDQAAEPVNEPADGDRPPIS
ncbi:nucleotide exchange factor GrpE [uncultured Jatrophihabitans sp.]|uniref:nucleotide exchange factor GrpE n=1 Tax=uncultured Jatrophihabitans sp. TaxID=1610747 RepID=UPI0035C9EA53